MDDKAERIAERCRAARRHSAELGEVLTETRRESAHLVVQMRLERVTRDAARVTRGRRRDRPGPR